MRSDLKTGTKILLAFASVLLLVVGMFGVTWWGNHRLSVALDQYQEQVVPDLELLQKLTQAETATRANAGVLANAAVTGTLRKAASERFEASLARVLESEQAWSKRPHGPAPDAAWSELSPLLTEWHGRADALHQLIQGQGATEAQPRMLESYLGLIDSGGLVTAQAKKLVAQVTAGSQQLRAAADRTQDLLGVVQIAGLALVVGLMLTIGLVLARSVARSVHDVIGEATRLRQAVADGQLAVRAEEGAVAPEFRPIVAGMNETMEAFLRPIQVTQAYITRISNGDIPPRISDHYQGDFDAIKSSLNRCIDSLSRLIGEMGRMSAEHEKGDIDAVIDASSFQGAYAVVAQGINGMVGAHLDVNRRAMEVFGEFGKGNTDAAMESLPGKKRFINQAIEQVRGNLKALVADAQLMAAAGVEGRLATRVDASRHHGDFRKIVDGFNATLDAVVGPLNVAARCVDQISQGRIPERIGASYNGDFGAIKENLNTCIDAINLLVADTGKLVEAAVAGRLATRVDVSKHQGDFKKVVDGVNQTLDAVLAPIKEATGVLDRLAQRDLRARIAGAFQGDHARIKDAVNATADALDDAMAQVAAAVEQVSSASTQIASSSQAVASGASEQASSLQQTSSSLESVLSITKQATDNAQQANALAQAARGAATEGSTAVEQMQGAMLKIRASAEGTSQIIRDINDIAFQTNLLALNAAVEAARAGEAGRGFAVVAEEVRSLALRAKEAAMKTEELIRQSVKEAGEGEVRSKQVAGKLGEIVSGIGKVSDIVSEIAQASKEQTSGIDQVNSAVGEMDKVTQQNAASAEESSSAASELSGQAEELAAMVGSFQLSRQQAAQAPRRPAVQASAARQTPLKLPPAKRNVPAQRKARPPAAFPVDDPADVRDF
jgi:methyl-accepting chemotaxis protein